MRIVHFSDWHARMRKLPEADLYVCTGDMLDDHPRRLTKEEQRYLGQDICHRQNWIIEREISEREQGKWITDFIDETGGFKFLLGSPDAPVACVAGNHDWRDMADLFAGCDVHEFKDNELVELCGLRVTGHRGIPFIYGTWNHETDRETLIRRVEAMPPADLFLTHYPPAGHLDSEDDYKLGVRFFGLEGMREAMAPKMDGKVAIHCFGHIHGSGGQVKSIGEGAWTGEGQLTLFSNASCHVNVIDI